MRNAHHLILLAGLLLLSACASLPENNQQTASYALANTADTTLGQSIKTRRDSDGSSPALTGMLLLDDGIDAFIARVAIARLAERSLDVQYYLYHSDLSAGLLTAELWRAAERGVRVRVLLDDMDMSGRDKNLAILDAHENIEVRLFNPFIRGKSRAGQFITRFGSVTRRSHNKAMIADNEIAIVGGRNIGDEYFGADPNLAFGDLDVALTNPAAAAVSEEFDLYWNSPLAYPVKTLAAHQPTEQELAQVENTIIDFYQQNQQSSYINALKNSQIIENSRAGTTRYHWGNATVLFDDPEKISSDRSQTEYHLTPKLAPYINGVKSELLVISPYFVPGKDGVEFFNNFEKQGVQVKILTNSLMSNDVPIVHAGYKKYRKKLLAGGVEIYELDKQALGKKFEREKSRKTREGIKGSKASLHAKYFVMDRTSAFIGSLNLDPRSVIENTEIGVVIESEQLALDLATHFDANIHRIAFQLTLEDNKLVWTRHYPDGTKKTYTKEPHSSWWDRVSVWFMGLLPAESQI